jgi:hypothetical protein
MAISFATFDEAMERGWPSQGLSQPMTASVALPGEGQANMFEVSMP